MAKARRRGLLAGQGLIYALSCFVSLGVWGFGFDRVMSGILTGPYFRAFFRKPTRYELATMVAILEVGAFITSLLAGQLGDMIGRKKTLGLGALIFSIGGAIQTCCNGFPVMVFGRIISGFGVGFLSMIVPVYQSEISPADHRGKLACIEFTGNIIGYASSVWIDYFCSFLHSNMSWRLPLSIQVLIGAFLAIGSLVIPESPRYLLDTEQDEAGLQVLADLRSDGDTHNEKTLEEFREIKATVYAERLVPRTYGYMWRRYRYRVLVAMSAQLMAQLNGINVISYYAPLVFEQAGWIGRDAILMAGINSLVYVASTIPTWYVVDHWGRRPILLSGAAIMAVALSLIGYFMYLDATFTPMAVVICVIIYNAFFGFSWGPIPWLYPPEILPLVVRVKGVSLSTATNWAANFLVGESTPMLQEAIRWRLYPMHAFFCVCSFMLVFFAYPETAGVPLEEMDRIFGDDPNDAGVSSEAARERESLIRPSRSSSPEPRAMRTPDQKVSPPTRPASNRGGGWLDYALGRGGRSKGDYEEVNG